MIIAISDVTTVTYVLGKPGFHHHIRCVNEQLSYFRLPPLYINVTMFDILRLTKLTFQGANAI